MATLEGAFTAPVHASRSTSAPALSITGGHAPVPSPPGTAVVCTAGAAVPPLASDASAPVGLATFPDSALGGVFANDSATQSYRKTATRTATDRYDNYYSLDFAFRYGTDSLRLQGSINTYCLVPSTDVTVTIHDSTFARVTSATTPTRLTLRRRKAHETGAEHGGARLDSRAG